MARPGTEREELDPRPDEGRDAQVFALPRMHRPGAAVPDHMIQNRTCIVCQRFGCVERLLTPTIDGGNRTGDNLLPVCETHSQVKLEALWVDSAAVRQWLVEHERIDLVLYLREKIK